MTETTATLKRVPREQALRYDRRPVRWIPLFGHGRAASWLSPLQPASSQSQQRGPGAFPAPRETTTSARARAAASRGRWCRAGVVTRRLTQWAAAEPLNSACSRPSVPDRALSCLFRGSFRSPQAGS